MIKTTAMMLEELRDYGNPRMKLSRMVRDGEIYSVVKGLYETDRNTPAHLLAGSVYGPSYISFEYALSFYGLIPEGVYTVTGAAFDKKKKKEYNTDFGTFTYRDVPSAAFSLEVRLIREGDYFYRIAGPEKALCDKLCTVPPVRNIKEMAELLTADLRIEEDDIASLDFETVQQLSERYRSGNVKRLAAYMRRLAR